nr:phosphotransferase [Methylorubrum aminovorans]
MRDLPRGGGPGRRTEPVPQGLRALRRRAARPRRRLPRGPKDRCAGPRAGAAALRRTRGRDPVPLPRSGLAPGHPRHAAAARQHGHGDRRLPPDRRGRSLRPALERVRGDPPPPRPAGRRGDALPPDAWFLFDWAEAIEAALAAAGTDTRPAHADPHASNLLFGPGGALQLVDFDMACDTDPHYQLGAFLNEACPFETPMKAGIEMAEGAFRPEVFNRARAYAAADDLHWALRALAMDRLSPRRGLEFRKFAAWRFLRCRMRVGGPGFEETLRAL